MEQTIDRRQGLLKKALAGNAAFSVLSGVTILLADRWLVDFLGLPETASLAVLGISLIVYAGLLWLCARRPKIRITDAWIVGVMDVVWVTGSCVRVFVLWFGGI